MKRTTQTLVIVSHVRHYLHEGQIYAYGPYAREIDIWADLFSEVRIAAPCRRSEPAHDCLAFTKNNISMAPQKETGGDTAKEKLVQALLVPKLCLDLMKALRRADAIHVRCPGNLGLLGVLLAPLFSRRIVCKYSNQWSSFPSEPLSWKFQRRILRSPWWRGPVTVYSQPSNRSSRKITPLFTSIMSSEHLARARKAATTERTPGRLRLLYVGRLTRSKNIGSVLSALAELRSEGIELSCTVVGDGPERQTLEKFCSAHCLDGLVEFKGGVPFEAVLNELERADILVLISETEGWPKAIAEGMAFGLVCIGSDRGLIPELLGSGRGITTPAGDATALASVLREIVRRPSAYEPMRAKAATWAQQFSLEGVRECLRTLLEEHWRTSLASRRDVGEVMAPAANGLSPREYHGWPESSGRYARGSE